jgi:FkbM family methyltransferase
LADTIDPAEIRTVVDLGANVGYSILVWKKRFPEARVVAVEPDEDNLQMCRKNVGSLPSVSLVGGCVAARTGDVTLDRSTGDAWEFRIASTTAEDRSGAGTVKAYSMPDLLRETGVKGTVDLLKCDIEGAERELFADCEPWISRVRRIIVELHKPYDSATFLTDVARGGVVTRDVTVTHSGGNEVVYLRIDPDAPV